MADPTPAIPPGCHLVVPFILEEGTWGELRRLAQLGAHYDDEAPIKLDWTSYHETSGSIITPNGVIIEASES